MKKKLFFVPLVASCGVSFAQPPFSQIHERNFGDQTTEVGNYVELSAISQKREIEITYKVICSIPGKVSEIYVSVGDFVSQGQALIRVDAMKVGNILGAEVKGKVTEILVYKGQIVEAGTLLMKIERSL